MLGTFRLPPEDLCDEADFDLEGAAGLVEAWFLRSEAKVDRACIESTGG